MIALLLTKSIHAKTHQGVRAKFSELFIKKDLVFPVEIFDSITLLFDSRQEADYDLEADISSDEAKELLRKATDFFKLTESYLQNKEKNED